MRVEDRITKSRMQLLDPRLKNISVVHRAYAIEAVDLGSIPGRVKPKTIKI